MTNDLIKIENKIFIVRGHKVMFDITLAELYEVKVKVLNQAVKRNATRFPSDFMFQLTAEEVSEVVTNCDHLKDVFKFRPTLPYVFTEQGVAMLAAVLNSQKAIDVNIKIMRAFVALRNYAISQTTQSKELKEIKTILMLHIENTDKKFSQTEQTIEQIITVLNNLIETPRDTKQIGFDTKQKE